MKKSVLLSSLLFIYLFFLNASNAYATQPVCDIISFRNNPNCGAAWNESGYTFTLSGGYQCNDFYLSGLSGLAIYPGTLSINLNGATNISSIEIDIFDNCGIACTEAEYVYNGTTYTVANTGAFSYETLVIPTNPSHTINSFSVSSFEGWVLEIRICYTGLSCPSAFTVHTSPTACGETDNGTASIDIQSGTITQVQWSTNTGQQTGNQATGLSPGTYSVAVTDNTGCTEVQSFTITDGNVNSVVSQKIIDSETSMDDKLGDNVAIHGNFALLGSKGDDANGALSGSAYLYEFDGSNWSKVQKIIPSDIDTDDRFGVGLAITENYAFIGSDKDDDLFSNSGAVYVYHYDGTSWTQSQKIYGSNAQSGQRFGGAIYADGNKVIIGSSDYDGNGVNNTGGAYIFKLDASTNMWVEEQLLIASDREVDDRFGISVSMLGNEAIIGADRDDDVALNAGAAYIFSFNGTNWVQTQKLLPSNINADAAYGFSVAMSCDQAIVGAGDDDEKAVDAGTVYAYEFNGIDWIEVQKIQPSSMAGDKVGQKVAMTLNSLVIGALSDDVIGGNAGAAYIYKYNGTSWVQEYKLFDFSGQTGDRFGSATAVYGDRVLIGAVTADGTAEKSGAAIFFQLPNTLGDIDNDGICDNYEGCPFFADFIINCGLTVSPKVFLQGPLVSSNMNAQITGLLPVTEPYTTFGYNHVGGGGETTTLNSLAATGDIAVVDWVVVELRDSNDSSTIVETRAALLLRNGEVVDTDGISPVCFPNSLPGDYYVSVRHRNHLGVMTKNPITLN